MLATLRKIDLNWTFQIFADNLVRSSVLMALPGKPSHTYKASPAT